MPGPRTSRIPPEEILKEAKVLAGKHRKTILLQGSKLKDDLLNTKLSDVLNLKLPGGSYQAKTVWLAAFLGILAEEGTKAGDRCASKLALVKELRKRISTTEVAAEGVEARLAADEASFQAIKASAEESPSLWDAWKKTVEDACGGFGFLNPYCFVALTFLSIFSQSSSDLTAELEPAEQLISTDEITLVRLQAELEEEQKALSEALSAYTNCLMQEVYPRTLRSSSRGTRNRLK